MATLPTKSFSTIVSNTIAGIQGRAAAMIDFGQGSPLRAIVEGFAGAFIWFEGLVLKVLQASRLSTAVGIDVDTFTADFMPVLAGSVTASLPTGSPRLGTQFATGQLTFARFTAAPSSCFIPAALSINPITGVITNAGSQNAATAQSNDGTQNFVVIADPTNPTYSATLGGFTLASGLTSIVVAASATSPGVGGNVNAGTITVMTSGITGIDTVNNVAAFVNGTNQESDSALKRRFAAYILGLSRGDYFGLAASVLSVAPSVQWALTENFNYDGSFRPGFFFVVADDGSGNPSPAFIESVETAVAAVRPLGVGFAVFFPVIITANVSMQITTANNFSHPSVVAQVAAVIANNINALGLGGNLPFSLLASWAYSVSGVLSVQDVVLNNQSGDAASIITYRLPSQNLAFSYQIVYATIKAGAIVVS